MPLATSAPLLADAQKAGYAVGAFNVENMEMAQAVVEAAEEARAPVIVQTTPSTLRYAGLELFFSMVASLAEKATVPVALHLDHGSSFELAAQALRAGYTSIMIDGSRLKLEDNIALTASVVHMCRPSGIPVEGELGQVGGKEDDMAAGNGGYTDPAEAQRFEQQTGISALAVGVGTAHGFYTQEPVLNKDLISELRNTIAAPMVLHGASGLADQELRECIGRGICKVNFATELRCAYSGGVRELFSLHPETYDPKSYGRTGRERVKDLVKAKMAVCGCAGRY